MSKKYQDFAFIMRAITMLQNEPTEKKVVPKWFKVLDVCLAAVFLCGFWSGVICLTIKLING